MKIVLVGAGSREFGPATIRDVLLSDLLCDGGVETVLVDTDPSGLPDTQAYAEAVAERLGRSATVTGTTRLADALPGADAVIVAIEINRYFSSAQDFHVPRASGFRQI
ncbi:MAG: alpha-galactosidase, partial [Gemmatimonadota bacterium]|nr:alpha-galactosidase [Gemmatimonadota bacterium]